MLLEYSLMVRAWVWSQPKLASNPSSANVLSVFKAACPVDAGDVNGQKSLPHRAFFYYSADICLSALCQPLG